MSVKEWNKHQVVLIKKLRITNIDQIYSFGQIFNSFVSEHNYIPSVSEIEQILKNVH